jgi:hypothetical protein
MSDANPVRQAQASTTKKKKTSFNHSLAHLSHYNDIVRERDKKNSQQLAVGIAEGGARTLDLEVGNIMMMIRATRSTD